MAVTGSEARVVWRGRAVLAWVPALLADRGDLTPTSVSAIRAAERARQAILAADLHTPAHWEPLARLLLRSEGVASSYLEGVSAPIAAIVAAQDDPSVAPDAAAWVAANLAAVDRAIAHAADRRVLTVDDLHAWHRILMRGHSNLPDHLIGAFRDEQGWIGGPTPLDAALVTAPPDRIAPLMDDLVAFLNLTSTDPVAATAAAHAQFEIIHPYGDGNGRLGRVLILWTLARRLGVRVLPPLSVRFAADPGGYLSGMTLFRLADADRWITWFADALTASTSRVTDVVTALADLSPRWVRLLDDAGVRSDASARRLLDILIEHPVLTARLAAGYLVIGERAARAALATLVDAGVLEPFDPNHATGRPTDGPPVRGRPTLWYVARGVIDLIITR